MALYGALLIPSFRVKAEYYPHVLVVIAITIVRSGVERLPAPSMDRRTMIALLLPAFFAVCLAT